ncbi:MAG: hypothetical protein ACOX6T_01285 [Myxococcales bacterium]
MRIRRWALGALVGLVAAGCRSEQNLGAVELQGPNSLAVAGRNLLVAMSTDAQLRAIQIDEQAFVRAPNPLFALSVPTASFPQAVAAWTSADSQKTIPFAFALSSATSQVSVVSTSSMALLGTVLVPRTTLAIAALAESADDDPRLALAVAPQDGGEGALHVATFPRALADDLSGFASVAFEERIALGDSVPQALVASPTDPNLLVVGDRRTTQGALAVVDLGAGSVERYDVGGPVRALAFDQVGGRVFGILDSAACAASGSRCGGLFAFGMASRRLEPSADAAPLGVPGTAIGLAVGPATVQTLVATNEAPGEPAKTEKKPLDLERLVLVSSTDGNVYPFDGDRLRMLDANPFGPSVEVTHAAPDGTATADENGPRNIELAEGAVRSEVVRVTYEGALLRDREGTVAGSVLQSGPSFEAAGVRAGDRVSFADPATCPEAEVAAVAADQLELSGVGASCAGAVSFTVRPVEEYVVAGGDSGYLGRVRASERFAYQGAYFHRPDDYDAAKPAITFEMGSGDPRRDASYLLDIKAGVSASYVTLTGLSFPGAIAYDSKTKRFFVAHLGGNAVVQLDPATVEWSSESAPTPSEKGIRVYR